MSGANRPREPTCLCDAPVCVGIRTGRRKQVNYAQIGLKLQSRRKKLIVDNEARFGYPDGYCLRQWALQYVGLHIKPIHNSPFSIYPR